MTYPEHQANPGRPDLDDSDPLPPLTLEKTVTPPQAESGQAESLTQPPDLADFDLQSCPTPRFDEPSPVQLESRGVTSQTSASLRTRQPPFSQSEFWTAQTTHKNSIAAKLRQAGRPELAQGLEHCHTEYTHTVCNDCGKQGRFPNRCDKFYCPECQPRLANDRRQSVEWWAKEIGQPKHVVLTLINIPDLTQGHVQELKHCFSKLRRRTFASNWHGGFYGIECTNEGRGWHLHLHALVDARWIDGAELARQWASVTNGFGKIVKVKDCRDHSYLQEVTKYAVKGSQLAAWTPDQITTFIDAFDGVRTFGVFGSLYGKRTEFADWLKELRASKPLCTCGSCSIRYYTEAEFLMLDLKPDVQTKPRPPSPDHATPDMFESQLRSQASIAAMAN